MSTAATPSALHADAVEVLARWVAPNEEQRALQQRFVAHLRANPDGMTKACQPDHVTAGVLVLSPELDRVLLNLHRKAQLWLAFGGHPEPQDQTLREAAAREGREESGIDNLQIDPDPVELNEHTVHFCLPGHTTQHLDVRYTAIAPDGAQHLVSDESDDVRWWPLDQLPPLRQEMLDLIAASRERWRQRQST